MKLAESTVWILDVIWRSFMTTNIFLPISDSSNVLKEFSYTLHHADNIRIGDPLYLVNKMLYGYLEILYPSCEWIIFIDERTTRLLSCYRSDMEIFLQILYRVTVKMLYNDLV